MNGFDDNVMSISILCAVYMSACYNPPHWCSQYVFGVETTIFKINIFLLFSFQQSETIQCY